MNRDESPFKGLASFEDSDSDALLFFGREREREIVVANLLASRLTVLYGDTGVGKTSVLRAGVARDLRALPEPLAVVVFDAWQDDPARTLELQIAEATGAMPQGRIADTLELGAALAGGDVAVLLDGIEEEFLYHGSEAGPGSFLDEFSEAVTRAGLKATFLLAVREDALAKLDRFKTGIPNVLGNYLRLAHLDRSAAREAIVGPIGRYNESTSTDPVTIEPELVEMVLDQVTAGKVELGQAGRGGVDDARSRDRVEAPYLQLVMATLWRVEADAGSSVLRPETLDRLGGAEQIVRDHLEGALDSLPAPDKDTAAAIFNHLVTPSGTKIAHDADDLAGYLGSSAADVQPVLSRLATERILRPVPGARGTDPPRYEIYHDVLAEAVLAWRAKREADRRLEHVRAAAAQRHRRLLTVTFAALLLVAALAGLTIYAFAQRSDAQAQARKAQARALDASALSQLSIDPELSLLLAVAAAKRDRSGQAEDVLRRSLAADHELRTFRLVGAVTVADYSPDGKLIIVGGTDGSARVYDSADAKLRFAVGTPSPITTGGFSPDGSVIATGAADGRIELWSARNGHELRALKNGAAIRSLEFAPTGAVLVATGGKHVSLFRTDTGRQLWSRRLGWPVTRAVFSPDGRFIAVIGNHPQAMLLTAATGEVVRAFDQGDFVKAVAFSPNGRLLATGGRNHAGFIWNVLTGKQATPELIGHAQDILDLVFSRDGRTLATASADGTARTWDVATGASIATFSGHAGAVTTVAFSHDEQLLLTTSADRTARIWRNSSSPDVVAVLAGDTDSVTGATFSPNGQQVLTKSRDDTARLWDTSRPRLHVLASFKGKLVGAAYVGAGEIAVAGPDSVLRILQTSTGRVRIGFPFKGTLTALAVSRDANTIAVAFGSRVALVSPGRDTSTVALEQPAAVKSVALSSNGAEIATGGTDGLARLWLADGRLLREFKGHRRAVTGVAFSPNGKLLATSSADGTARIWETRTGQSLHVLALHTKPVTSVAFSPDGRYVLTSSQDRDARLWNATTGTPVQLLRWHFGTVRDAQFSPDGRWIVTAGPISAQLWQPGVQQPFFEFGIEGPTKALTSATFDPTSRVVLAASQDGTVRTYRCALCGGLDSLLQLAQAQLALTGQTLTPAELKAAGG